MNTGCKINREQRDALLRLYVKGGFKAIEETAAQLGVTPKYIANVASTEGLRREKAGRCTQTENDPRWEWARQRGAGQHEGQGFPFRSQSQCPRLAAVRLDCSSLA